MVAAAGKAASSPAHRDPAIRQASFNLAETCFEDLETALLVEALAGIRIAPGPCQALTHGSGEAALDRGDPCPEAGRLRPQVSPADMEGVLGGSGDGPGPAGRGVP